MMVISVVALISYLFFTHGLWYRPSDQIDRQYAGIFNATSVITLTIGALTFYVALFALTLASAGLVIEGGVLGSATGRPSAGLGDYATLSWITTSLATLGGALSSGLQTSEDVREAAYIYRRECRKGDDENYESES